uniref:Uncharacterized protein n=1 Tax=Populus trichocarpa TaxID=3694 RepID=A0A3N7FPX0_POPTR
MNHHNHHHIYLTNITAPTDQSQITPSIYS